MFLRKSRVERDPLAVTMSGVRLGEKALQIGEGDTRLMALIAGKAGLTGKAAIVLLDGDAAMRVQRAIDDAGALAEVSVVDRGNPPGSALDDASFDVVVVHDVPRTIRASDAAARSGWLELCLRVLRGGGRVLTIERGTPVGLKALFGSGRAEGAGVEPDSMSILSAAGFRGVRLLADREGLRFVEGFKKTD